MTDIRIPAVTNSAGDEITARVRIALIDARGRAVIGWHTGDGVPVLEALDDEMTADDYTVDLIPTDEIALDSLASPTWYEITIQAGGRTSVHRVQVPDDPSEVLLSDLIGAESVAGGTLAYPRLLPDPTDVPDGWILAAVDGAPVWAAGSGSSASEIFPAAVDLGGHRMVAIESGQAVYADSSVPAHAGTVIGMTTGAAVAGADATILTAGRMVEPSWTWTPDAPIYLRTSGQISQTPPTSGMRLSIGFALAATIIMLKLGEPIILADAGVPANLVTYLGSPITHLGVSVTYG